MIDLVVTQVSTNTTTEILSNGYSMQISGDPSEGIAAILAIVKPQPTKFAS